jgi:hypothetical protein
MTVATKRGRPQGSRNKKSLEKDKRILALVQGNDIEQIQGLPELTADKIVGMSPLDMIHYAAVVLATKGMWAAAGEMASKLAPYRHPRLSHVVSNTTLTKRFSEMNDDELATLISEGEGQDGIDDEGEG